MDKEIHGLQNCIDSIIREEDLSYLMFCQLVIFIGQIQSSCNTLYFWGGFEIMNVCQINYSLWVSVIFQ